MKIFISGSKELSSFPIEASNYIKNLCEKGYEIIIGDCYGVDTVVQFLLEEIEYKNVTIYTAKNKARVNLGNWKEINIITDSHGYKAQYYKDQAMIENCDFAIAIWNGKSKGTHNNIISLKIKNKSLCVFYVNQSKENIFN